MKVLVTGVSDQLAPFVIRTLQEQHDLVLGYDNVATQGTISRAVSRAQVRRSASGVRSRLVGTL
jgi:nucleoside-diphosphate-sugar epimerase